MKNLVKIVIERLSFFFFSPREAFELKIGILSMVVEVRMQQHNYVESVFVFLYFPSILQTLLEWWNACGFLTSVAKQNSSNSLKFRWLLVTCLCGSFSLSFGSKTLGGISVSDLNPNVFLIGKLIPEIEKDGKRKWETVLLEQFNLYTFLQHYFPGITTKMTLKLSLQ